MWLQELDVTCSSAGRGQLVIGDQEGTVFILDKQLSISAFRAYSESVTHLHQLRQHNLLFTVGVSCCCCIAIILTNRYTIILLSTQ